MAHEIQRLDWLCGILLVAVVASSQRSGHACESTTEQSVQQELADQILSTSGIRGGLVVHFGCRDGQLTAALRRTDSYLVHGLATDADMVQQARQKVAALGLYGRVSIDRLGDNALPYVDAIENCYVLSGKEFAKTLRKNFQIRIDQADERSPFNNRSEYRGVFPQERWEPGGKRVSGDTRRKEVAGEENKTIDS